MTDEEAVNNLVATIEKEVGVIDILVNNAGIMFLVVGGKIAQSIITMIIITLVVENPTSI